MIHSNGDQKRAIPSGSDSHRLPVVMFCSIAILRFEPLKNEKVGIISGCHRKEIATEVQYLRQ